MATEIGLLDEIQLSKPRLSEKAAHFFQKYTSPLLTQIRLKEPGGQEGLAQRETSSLWMSKIS